MKKITRNQYRFFIQSIGRKISKENPIFDRQIQIIESSFWIQNQSYGIDNSSFLVKLWLA